MIIPTATRLQYVQEYYFARKLAEVRALSTEEFPIINLGIGNPDLPPSEPTISALAAAVTAENSHGYQPYQGTAALREAMASWYNQTFGTRLSQAEVLPLMGSKEGILHISMAFLDAGDEVLVPDPGYPAYAAAARLAGATPVPYTLCQQNNWLPDRQQLLELAGSGKVKVLWINYPHMPTGAEATAETLQWLVEFALAHRILLINDNPYSLVLPLNPPLSLLSIAGAGACCLELNSLSKSHNMAGWRVGMVLGQPAYLAAILAVKSNIDSGMFLPVQQAAIEALQNSAQWHARRNALYAARRVAAHRLLTTLGCRYQAGATGMFVWASVPDEVPDVEAYLDELLYESRIFITPGSVFGNQGMRYLRISLCVPVSQLEEATKRIKSKQETFLKV